MDKGRKLNLHKMFRRRKGRLKNVLCKFNSQKQPSKGFLRKRCSENMQQISRRTPVQKCDFNKVEKLQSNFIETTLRHGCSPVNLLYIFRTSFSKNTSGWLLLHIILNLAGRSFYSSLIPNSHELP